MARRERSYYDGSRKSSRKERSRRRLSIAVDSVMFAVSAAIAIAVVLSWASRWINPAGYGFMSSAGLLMPILLAANCLCLLYWILRWRPGAFIPLAIFALGLLGMTLFFRPQFTEHHADLSRDRSLVNVMTYNVHGLHAGVDRIVRAIDSLKPDILCMQEFYSTRNSPRGRFDEALPTLPYKSLGYNLGSEGAALGNAIYSRHPISASGHIDFEGTDNSVMWADVVVERDTVRVFCAHLQTTSIKADDERYIVDGDFVGDSTRTSKIRRMSGSLTRGNIVRAVQADTLASRIASSPYRVIVCGDFNDTPVSYTYRRIAHRLRDSFREAGHGYGYTYRGFFNMLRIDYILHSRSMDCVWYSSPSFDASDHNPVAVKIRLH